MRALLAACALAARPGYEHPHLSDATAEAVLRHLPARGGRVLDVGCGPGEPALTIAHRGDLLGVRVTATDAKPAMVQLAQALAEQEDVAAFHAEVARAEDLGNFSSGSFDAVTAQNVLYLLPEPGLAAALREMHRVLRPGGRAVVSVFKRHAVVEAVAAAVGERPANDLLALRHAGAVEAPARGAGFLLEDEQRLEEDHDLGAEARVMQQPTFLGASVAHLDAEARAGFRERYLAELRRALARPEGWVVAGKEMAVQLLTLRKPEASEL